MATIYRTCQFRNKVDIVLFDLKITLLQNIILELEHEKDTYNPPTEEELKIIEYAEKRQKEGLELVPTGN